MKTYFNGNPQTDSYIAASYVKWLEAAGARVVLVYKVSKFDQRFIRSTNIAKSYFIFTRSVL